MTNDPQTVRATKRKRPESFNAHSPEPAKQARLPTPTSTQAREALSDQFGLEMDPGDFKMLCGYLCALLNWGYRIHVHDIDAFVVLHLLYLSQLPQFEETQLASPSWATPSYHQWFAAQDLAAHGFSRATHPIIDARRLRAIGEENPCTFRLAALALEYIQEHRL
ncbi:hypothetical protein AYL99_05186 [Fonsecaea erecta]|uniref:Uncharacterized protein n=1 Tax=Fonsecaea erecta TaxID=1367422 RepID=A0A178ZK67_9EURO|nr:hypothetical protein AYL99_05186 [Fonsecaea erecta]OAP60184.1 hypothetical protein AYL99_05186 [Fonsecaea erecta]